MKNIKQLSRNKKLEQLENTIDVFRKALKREGYIIYKEGITITDNEIQNYINNIDITKYFGIEPGQNIACLRVSCNNSTGANFYKHKGNTLYKCHYNCNCIEDTQNLFGLMLEIYKQQLGTMDYNVAMKNIKLDFMPDYKSDFYVEFENIIEHNRMMIETLNSRKNLAILFKRRNLMEFYIDFTELALIYMKEDEDIPYSFYCANSVLKRTFKYVFGKKGSNYLIDKANILVALGLIEKLDEDTCSKRMREKIIQAKRRSNKNMEYTPKSTSAYRLRKLTLEDIEQAEKIAKFIIENKIYNINANTFKEVSKANKKRDKLNETFVRRAKKVIKEELKLKGYIQLHKICGKIDPKYKYYKTKAEKEKFLEDNLRRIINDYKLDIVLVDKNARKLLKLTRSVKDDTKILVRKNNKDLTMKLKVDKDENRFIQNVETIGGKSRNFNIEEIELDEDIPFI